MKIIILLVLFLSQSTFANDCFDFSSTTSIISKANLQTLKLYQNIVDPDLNLCVSQIERDYDFDIMRAFNAIKVNHPEVINRDCISLSKLKTHQKEVQILMTKLRGEGVEYALVFSANNPSSLYLTSGNKVKSDHYFKNKESLFDSEMIINPIYGVLLSKEAYKGQADKNAHAISGAGISIGTSIVGGLIIEKTNYSSDTKKAIMQSIGPLSGLVIGILKEVLYDMKRKDRHTVDAHDALATGIGAGIIPITVTFKF